MHCLNKIGNFRSAVPLQIAAMLMLLMMMRGGMVMLMMIRVGAGSLGFVAGAGNIASGAGSIHCTAAPIPIPATHPMLNRMHRSLFPAQITARCVAQIRIGEPNPHWRPI